MAATAADNVTEDLTSTLWRDDEWLKCACLALIVSADPIEIAGLTRLTYDGLQP